ncbi:hypothetical protein [Staphylococcus simulans]|uniref:hypothetical protein n=1 Tax=Staphylococcus simulans TaxID=1286 RepID=UPI003F7D9888
MESLTDSVGAVDAVLVCVLSGCSALAVLLGACGWLVSLTVDVSEAGASAACTC